MLQNTIYLHTSLQNLHYNKADKQAGRKDGRREIPNRCWLLGRDPEMCNDWMD